MYFTALKEIKRTSDFDPNVLGAYRHLILVHLGALRQRLSREAMDVIKGRAGRIQEDLYLFVDPDDARDDGRLAELFIEPLRLITPFVTPKSTDLGFFLVVPASIFDDLGSNPVTWTFPITTYIAPAESIGELSQRDLDQAALSAMTDVIRHNEMMARQQALTRLGRDALKKFVKEAAKLLL